MEIFGKFKNGIDAQNFCKKSLEEKKSWILKNTYMQDEAIIDDFLSKPLNNNDCGCGCGGNKQKLIEDGSNIASGSAEKIDESKPEGNTSSNRKGNRRKR